VIRGLAHCLLSLGAFVATCALVRPFVPVPEAGTRRSKWEYFDEHADEFDAVFLGSSHMFRSIKPRRMEEELNARGYRFHGFNLGFAAGHGLETDFWVQRVIERRPQRLRWIFVEAGFWRTSVSEEPQPYVRYYHTPSIVRHLVSMALGSNAPLRQRLEVALRHVLVCLQNLTNYGEGPRLVGRTPPSERGIQGLSTEVLERDLGFQSKEDADPEGIWHAKLLEKEAQWRETIERRTRQEARILRQEPPRHVIEGPNARWVADQVRRTEEAGHRLIFIAPPRSQSANAILMMDQGGVYPRLLNFGTPVLAPELFEFELWHDYDHLGDEGAELFSLELVDRLARMMKKRER